MTASKDAKGTNAAKPSQAPGKGKAAREEQQNAGATPQQKGPKRAKQTQEPAATQENGPGRSKQQTAERTVDRSWEGLTAADVHDRLQAAAQESESRKSGFRLFVE